MNDDTMPERLYLTWESEGTEIVYVPFEKSKYTTEYIRADVAQAQLDAANARIAELEAALRIAKAMQRRNR